VRGKEESEAEATGAAVTTILQQGNYLGRMLRDTNFDSRLIAEYPSFTMTHYGAMAYLGASQGVAELKGMLWDRYPVSREPNENTIVEGTGAFALWRSLYFSRLLSNRNKAQVIFDWFKASVFGRDISSPYVLRPSPSPSPVPETSGRAKAQGKAP
jgi:NADH dehydrogenase FAD-containing subunit